MSDFMKPFFLRFASHVGLAAAMVFMMSDAAMANARRPWLSRPWLSNLLERPVRPERPVVTRPRRPRPVPGPAPVLGVMLAAGWMRKLRKESLADNEDRT